MDYEALFKTFVKKYNPVKSGMTPFEAFSMARDRNDISEEGYRGAEKYFGRKWHFLKRI